MKARKGARIVVLNPAGAVLLVRYHDPTPVNPSKPELLTYLVPPGGGVHEGESFERAAIRERRGDRRNRTREKIEEIRWWTLDELRASTETFLPEGFVELVAPVMVGDVPSASIDIT